MDFIKTSSLRALIELTFQRNWNGLIWMSRKGVTTKRVKTGSIENQRPTAQSGWPRNECSALGQIIVRPSEVSAKVQTVGRTHHDPGNIARGRPRHNLTPRRARPKPREPGKRLAAAQLVSRTTPMHPSEPGNYVPRPAEISSAKSHPSDRHPYSATTRLSGRSSRPTVPTPRSTRSPF
ncbi:unnamed protein product [Microthlaspi erraticum]|uniref:Uncharacterized protein n=1 Tax=Microthlaspi erraticum TaxID=1685480 RepID=A0A6D2JET2_9BRAS|nr:unnamed protein product [Microthlaspi erraticum]